jgi:hypothetical protein
MLQERCTSSTTEEDLAAAASTVSSITAARAFCYQGGIADQISSMAASANVLAEAVNSMVQELQTLAAAYSTASNIYRRHKAKGKLKAHLKSLRDGKVLMELEETCRQFCECAAAAKKTLKCLKRWLSTPDHDASTLQPGPFQQLLIAILSGVLEVWACAVFYWVHCACDRHGGSDLPGLVCIQILLLRPSVAFELSYTGTYQPLSQC